MSDGGVLREGERGVFLSRRMFSEHPGDVEQTVARAVVEGSGPVEGGQSIGGRLVDRMNGLMGPGESVRFHSVAGAPGFPPVQEWVPVLVEGSELLVSAEAARLVELLPVVRSDPDDPGSPFRLRAATSRIDMEEAQTLSTTRLFRDSTRAFEVFRSAARVVVMPLADAGRWWARCPGEARTVARGALVDTDEGPPFVWRVPVLEAWDRETVVVEHSPWGSWVAVKTTPWRSVTKPFTLAVAQSVVAQWTRAPLVGEMAEFL